MHPSGLGSGCDPVTCNDVSSSPYRRCRGDRVSAPGEAGASQPMKVQSMAAAAPAGTVDNIVARIERLPTSWWHVKTRIIVGVATFFDAFDALAVATVLPVLVPLWKIAPPQIGLLISAGSSARCSSAGSGSASAACTR